jgi:hypothetical protein
MSKVSRRRTAAPPSRVRVVIARLATGGVLLFGGSLGGCAVDEWEQPTRLSEVAIARDFMFATQRVVFVTLEGEVDRANLLVEVRSPESKLLYRGPLGLDDPLRLPAAGWMDRLIVTVDRGEGPQHRTIPIDDGWVRVDPRAMLEEEVAE